MNRLRPIAYTLTCPPRLRRLAKTQLSWRLSDWGSLPLAVSDQEPELPGEEWGTPMRALRVVAAFQRMLEVAVSSPGDAESWLLFSEDDIEVHPRIGAFIDRWPALRDPRCGMASLFNPSLHAVSTWGEMDHAFAAEPETFFGSQALLLRRAWAARALDAWDTVRGLQSQRLAQLFGGAGPIWMHRPSLVQHVAEDSSWGAQVQTAPDFNPVNEA